MWEPAGLDFDGTQVLQVSPRRAPLSQSAAKIEGGMSAVIGGVVVGLVREGGSVTVVMEMRGELSSNCGAGMISVFGGEEFLVEGDRAGQGGVAMPAFRLRRARCASRFWIFLRSAGFSTPYQQSGLLE